MFFRENQLHVTRPLWHTGIVLTILMAIHILGAIFVFIFPSDVCYSNKVFVALDVWLLGDSGVSLSLYLFLLIGFISVRCGVTPDISVCAIAMISCLVTMIVVGIFGIVELFYQHTCSIAVPFIYGSSLVSIISKIFSITGFSWFILKANADEETYSLMEYY